MKYKKFHRAIYILMLLKNNRITNFTQLLNAIQKLGYKLASPKDILSREAFGYNFHAPRYLVFEVADDLMLMRDMGYVDGFALTDKGLNKLEEIKKNSVSTDNERGNRIWKRIWADLEKNTKMDWAEMMSDEKRQSIAISMLKEAKKVGGMFRNRNIMIG